jgi:acylphosphatase
MTVERRHFLVSGRVQGVGFRAFVHRTARALGVAGGARNLEDGRVEILAKAERTILAALETAVKQGPERSAVDELVILTEAQLPKTSPQWLENANDFLILEDGVKPWH